MSMFFCCTSNGAAHESDMEIEQREVRTSKVPACPPQEALTLLKEGNERFTGAETQLIDREALKDDRKAFVADGQKPMAAIVSCADSRAPVDHIFDTIPGDLFVLRNAGNTLARAEGSFVGSLEYAISHLDTKLILILGHTKCGAVCGATKTFLSQKDMTCAPCKEQSALEVMLAGIVPSAKQAAAELPGASEDQIATRAIRLNVFLSMQRLFQYSPVVRKMVMSGEVQVHGGIYDLETGKVDFLGEHPSQSILISSHLDVTESHDAKHDQMAPAQISGLAMGA